MVPEGSNRQPAPRTINVQKFAESRASELESLHSIVANRLDNNFRCQRNKRRRTTSHDNKASNRRRKRQKHSQSNNPELKTVDKFPRCIRRRNELKKNPQSGFSMSGDGTKRLRTHVWHAKRFTMIKLWGFHLPLGLHGRGRGSRAFLRRFRGGAVLHDASYHIAIQLDGPQDSLISILRMVLVPSPLEHPTDMCPFLRGATYERVMLHHVGEPTGIPIAPVICVWRPLNKQNSDNSVQDFYTNGHSEPQDSEDSNPFRQLWVWIHASAFEEGFNALNSACLMEMDAKSNSISCFSLEGQIAEIEVMGSSASELLEKILHPITRVSEKSFKLRKHSEVVSNDSKMNNHISLKDEQFSDSAVLSLVVKDPRACREKRVTDVQTTSNNEDGFTLPVQVEEQAPPRVQAEDHGGSPSSSTVCSEIKDLWDASRGMKPPVEESVLCQERHDRHMESYCLSYPNSRTLNNTEVSQSSRTCPVMLLRRHSLKYPFMGWSILLPLSWVRSFWVPLVTMGAHAVGLREKHWISNEVGIPCFPSDFPDCSAYASLKATEAAASGSKTDLRPPKLRPAKIPIPPPWIAIRPDYDEVPPWDGTAQIPAGREIYNMRTSCELYLFEETFGGLLFPRGVGREVSMQKALKKEADPCRDNIIHIRNESRLCFLRVILRAFREGVFEEGAVVCAPLYSDISLWISRPEDNNNRLRIPDSAVASYFKEEPSGAWVLQTPVDPLARESHRRPIGFVTSGLVRGSKRPAAIAICEASSLARLRAEQWSEMPVKQRKMEIYVLVRNLRSSAYRLALATIVLEHQEDDVVSL